jgi:hypothetical protein
MRRLRFLPLLLLFALFAGCDHNVVGPGKIPKDVVLYR